MHDLMSASLHGARPSTNKAHLNSSHTLFLALFFYFLFFFGMKIKKKKTQIQNLFDSFLSESTFDFKIRISL